MRHHDQVWHYIWLLYTVFMFNINWFANWLTNFYRVSACLCMQSMILLWQICLSVHLSVTLEYCIKTNAYINLYLFPPFIHSFIFFMRMTSTMSTTKQWLTQCEPDSRAQKRTLTAPFSDASHAPTRFTPLPSGRGMTSFFRALLQLQNSKGISISVDVKYWRWGKCDFRQKSSFISETVRNKCIVRLVTMDH